MLVDTAQWLLAFVGCSAAWLGVLASKKYRGFPSDCPPMEGNSRYEMLFPRGSTLCITQTWSGCHVSCCRVMTVSLVLE